MAEAISEGAIFDLPFTYSRHLDVALPLLGDRPEWIKDGDEPIHDGYLPSEYIIKIGMTSKMFEPQMASTKIITADKIWLYNTRGNNLIFSTSKKETKEVDFKMLKEWLENLADSQLAMSKKTVLQYCQLFAKDEDHLCSYCEGGGVVEDSL
ncbi:hypothetical protein M9H77_27007 [Catharanthus roseus]|uniref:Uncharacterized protein n=1 Tax=Catharanthus roseus TaxID=4058 RepID=A0ACC0ADF9_CATRO|nr:hypothetical protein M9H77_27007 [Catharanthus roseus]